jgi:two-component system sensor histidine kinase/response regulator
MNRKIFIVEDSPTQLEQLKIVLEDAGFEYDFAINGREALEKINSNLPDLVITDIVMPEMDGYELCKAIKSNSATKNIPVMLLTTLSDPADVIKGLEAGADNFMTKPYNPDTLISRINFILVNMELRKNTPVSSDVGIQINFGGKNYFINSNKMQILDLLLSTYENAIQKNQELIETNKKLTELHKEMARKNLQLQKLNEDKNKFLSMAAHDIRNPVGLILSYSQLILEDYGENLKDDVQEFIGIIRRSADFVLKLLTDLLNVAVIEAGGELKLSKEENDLVDIIKTSIVYNKIAAEKKSMKLNFITDIQELKFNFDKVKIEQVMHNLISNAIKYSYSNTEINVYLNVENSLAEVCVEDHGQGIPENEIQLLFKPFSKTSAKTTGGESSTGLGLNIVKKIIDGHGGKVWAESEVGKGSKFYFSLPLQN